MKMALGEQRCVKKSGRRRWSRQETEHWDTNIEFRQHLWVWLHYLDRLISEYEKFVLARRYIYEVWDINNKVVICDMYGVDLSGRWHTQPPKVASYFAAIHPLWKQSQNALQQVHLKVSIKYSSVYLNIDYILFVWMAFKILNQHCTSKDSGDVLAAASKDFKFVG